MKTIDFNTISSVDWEIVIDYLQPSPSSKMNIYNKKTKTSVILDIISFYWFGIKNIDKVCQIRTVANIENPFLSNEFPLNIEQFEKYCINYDKIKKHFAIREKLMNL